MTEPTPTLREKQIEQLAFYIHHPKCLDLSDPGTGKTPPCCVYAYYVNDRLGKSTIWTMPKSLLKKNRAEMLRFTEFKEHEVKILYSDHAPMTKSWTGPVLTREKRVKNYPCIVTATGERTDTMTLRKRSPGVKIVHNGVELGTKRAADIGLQVEPILGPDGLPQSEIVMVPEQSRDLIKAAADAGVRVVICTFDFGREHWARLVEAFPDFDLLLVDELHMAYGGMESGLTESFFFLNQHCSRFVGMTGTLINGKLSSAFPALHAIEPRYYGSPQGFMFEHALVTDDYGRVVMWTNEAKLSQIIRQHSIRRTFKEVYGDEDVVFFPQYIDLNEKLRVEYDKFHDEAMLELDDGRVLDGSLPGVAFTRARQIMAHPETMGIAPGEMTGKDERLLIHLSEGQKCLIFASLIPEQNRIKALAESLGLRVGLINSTASGPNRAKIDAQAQAGELDVIVASGPTAAVGWNWEMFDHVIFVSISFLDVDILQAYRRASRGTRTKTLRVTFMIYRNTVDIKVYKIVTVKSELANRVDSSRPILIFEEPE